MIKEIFACSLHEKAVEWNGHIFMIDLDKVSTKLRDQIRDKEPFFLFNPKTQIAKVAVFVRQVTSSDQYIYHLNVNTDNIADSLIRVVISNIH